jgi:hypothetical protein
MKYCTTWLQKIIYAYQFSLIFVASPILQAVTLLRMSALLPVGSGFMRLLLQLEVKYVSRGNMQFVCVKLHVFISSQ